MTLSYLSKTPGIGGKLKSEPVDFIVEEIDEDGTIYELDKSVAKPDVSGGRVVHFILQKQDWSTSSAISTITKRVHSSPTRFNTAGTKDKVAVTTQRVSVSGVSKEQISSVNIKDMKINGAWLATDRVRIGELLGNRFTIRVRNPTTPNLNDRIKQIARELGGVFPNYFGEQRFGSTRNNTHTIGLQIMRGELEQAVHSYLCDSTGERNELAVLARKELSETKNYAGALKTFPQYLRLERTMIATLAKNQTDYVGALRTLPRSILLMFIHAVQSHIFNLLLSERISESVGLGSTSLELEEGEFYCGMRFGFPDISKSEASGFHTGKLIGYETQLNPREKRMLESLSVSKDEFRLKFMSELASKGTRRVLFAPLKDFTFFSDTTTFKFSLPSGCYATVAMREFMDQKDSKNPEVIGNDDESSSGEDSDEIA